MDAYQEALDLCAYTRQKYEQTSWVVWCSFHTNWRSRSRAMAERESKSMKLVSR